MPENLPEPHTSQAQWDGVTKWSKRTSVNMLGCTVACCAGSLVPCLCVSHSSRAWVGTKRSFHPPTLFSTVGQEGRAILNQGRPFKSQCGDWDKSVNERVQTLYPKKSSSSTYLAEAYENKQTNNKSRKREILFDVVTGKSG